MSNDEIISMAREAGIKVYAIVDTHLSDIDSLSAFAALVSARAAAIELEACAKVCDDLHHKWHWGEDNPESGPHDCASAIRARGDKDEQ